MKFREKSEPELDQQLAKAETIFGTRLAPRDWKGLSKYDLQYDHKVRYEQYLSLLRQEKGEGVEIEGEARTLIGGLNNLEEFIRKHKEGEQEILRSERQINVFDDLHSFLEKGEMEGYVKLPTGVGKTVIFLKLVEALGLKSLIVVPSKILVNQTGEKIEEFTDIEFGKVFSEEKDYSKPVTVTTYSSLINGVESGTIDPSQFSVLILDEVHRSLSEKRAQAINRFNCIKIGFTATPKYSNAKTVENLLGAEIHSMELHEAILEGLLCETHTMHAFTDVDLSNVTIKNGEYDPEELEKKINVYKRNKAAVELYKKAFIEDKIVCYCTSVAHAQSLESLFKEEGVSCAVITGETPTGERKKILEKYKSGEIRVLLNVKVLVEGFDEPSCNVAFNLHPTLSIIDAEQRGGRPLRLEKNNNDKIGYVVDFIDKNKENPPVLFSEILGGSCRVPENSPKSVSKKPGNGGEIMTKEDLLASLEIEGLRIEVSADAILQVSNDNKSKRITEVPEQKEGWESVYMVAARLNLSPVRIRTYLFKLVTDSEKEIERQRGKDGKALLFYHPDLVKKAVSFIVSSQEIKVKQQEDRERKKIVQEAYDAFVGDRVRIIEGVPEQLVRRYIRKLVDEDIKQKGKDAENTLPELSEALKATIIEKSEIEKANYPSGITADKLMEGHHNRLRFEMASILEKIEVDHPEAVTITRAFGEDIKVYDMTTVLSYFNDLGDSFRERRKEFQEQTEFIFKSLGMEAEEGFVSRKTVNLLKSENIDKVKKQFAALKKQQLSEFKSIPIRTGKTKIFIPSSLVQEINELIRTLEEEESNEVMGGGSFWERQKARESSSSPWSVSPAPSPKNSKKKK
jgi:superfamily II DNA or RNA helicase